MTKNKKYSNKIKYTCDKCKYVKPYTKKEHFKKNILSQLNTLFIMLGIIFIAFLIFINPVVIANMFASQYMTIHSELNYDELRKLAINATVECDKDGYRTSSFCNGFHIYSDLKNLRYVPQSMYKIFENSKDTYLYGGDCKHMSMLYVSMVQSIGFDAQVICNQEEEHCVAILFNENGYEKSSGYAVVDLTIPGFYSMREQKNLWDYQNVGIKYE